MTKSDYGTAQKRIENQEHSDPLEKITMSKTVSQSIQTIEAEGFMASLADAVRDVMKPELAGLDSACRKSLTTMRNGLKTA